MIVRGDCLDVMRAMPEGCVDCVVTSPPYWGLRDYGVEGQLGLEPTPEEYVARMVDVFAEVRRVLKDEGTCWLNLGDSYAAGKMGRTDHGTDDPTVSLAGNSRGAVAPGNVKPRKAPPGFKAKDLVGIPWRVALALQADGWYLRSDIIWSKPNPMPESVRDRPTKAHEYVFLLSKSARYWYDAEAIEERETCGRTRGPALHPDTKSTNGNCGLSRRVGDGRRNCRTVWTITSQPCSEAHFATMPPKLAERCILAGCPKAGIVLDPFAGAGTTGLVAAKRGRRFVGIELNAEYARIARRRIEHAQDEAIGAENLTVGEAPARQGSLFA